MFLDAAADETGKACLYKGFSIKDIEVAVRKVR